MSSLRYFCLFVLSLFLISESAQAQINGLDYTLQKRRKAEKFDTKRFSDHMFISGGIGANLKLSRDASGIYAGPLTSFYVGKWFTPVIGSRIGLDASYMSVNNGYRANKAGIVGVNWDYLMNLSAFANHYNPDRLFELVGILGVSYHNAFRHASYRHVWGVSGGFQGKFNLSPLVDVFIEPKLSFYGDKMDNNLSWRKYDLFGSVMLGVSYKMVPLENRITTRFFPSFWSNMFMSGGIGIRVLVSKQMLSADVVDWFGPSAQVALGGWITPVSGIRLSVDGGFSNWKAPVNGTHYWLKTAELRADYLLNFNTAFGGYNRNRLFEVIGVAGIEGAYAKKSADKATFAPGVGVGLQGNLRLTKDLDLYIEPRISFYTNKFAGGETLSKLDALTSLNVGITYNTVEREIRKNRDKFANNVFSDNMFIAFSGGLGGIISQPRLGLTTRQALSAKATLSLGKWFTPVSGLRINGTGMIIGSAFPVGRPDRYNAIIAGVDYMFNITSAFTGYKEDRLFNLIVAAGPSAFYRGQKIYPALEAGLQAHFSVTPNWGIFLEPHLLWAANRNALSALTTYKSLLPTVNIGASYTFRGYDRAANRTLFDEGDRSSYFVSVSGGASMYVNNEMFREGHIGPIGRFSLGQWFSPISAWRLSFTGEKIKDNTDRATVYGGVDADYMLNLSTLAAGYNQDRVFTLNGILGAKFGISATPSRELRFIPGVTAGLQGSFRLNPALDLFLEPQASMFLNRFDGIRNQNLIGNVFLGLNYKMKNDRSGTDSKKGKDRFANNVFSDNMFIAISGGFGGIVSRPGLGLSARQALSAKATLSLGKWFTPVSGLRVNGTGMIIGSAFPVVRPDRYNAIIAGIDYMFNLTSAFGGYKEDRLLDLFVAAGPSAFYRGQKIYPALEAGLQARANVTPNWGIFLEPHLLWAINRNALSALTTYKSVLPTANIGFSYTFRGYDRAANRVLFDGESGSSYFISVSGGISMYVNNEMFRDGQAGPIGRISLGRWFSPISAWRLSLSGERVRDQKGEFTVHGGLDADYMLNLSTLAAGYNPDRLFSLSGILGAKFGLAATSSKELRFIPGVTAGLQGSFRVNSVLDIFLEPQASMYFNRFDGIRDQQVVGNVLLGLNYKLKNKSESSSAKGDMENPTFVSAAVGTGVWGNTIVSRNGEVKDKLSFNADIALGRWFNSVSGIRLSLGTNTFRTGVWHDSDKMTVLSLRADYLANLTSCFSGYDPDRFFDMIGIIGVGAAFPTSAADAKTTYTATVGLQAKFNINRKLSLFVEPRGTFFGDKIDGKKCYAKFDAAANLLIGTTYSF